MRRTILTILMIWTVLGLMTEASADVRNRFRSGAWAGGAMYDKKDRFGYCYISGTYHGNIELFILESSTGALSIVLRNQAWNLKPGTNYRVHLRIDQSHAKDYAMIVQAGDPKRRYIFLKRDQKLFNALRGGRRLTLSIAKRNFHFRLTGTSIALERMRACVQTATGRRPPASKTAVSFARNPFGGDRRINWRNRTRVAKDTIVALLKVAKLRAFTLFDDDRRNRLWPFVEQAWTDNAKIVGAALSIPRPEGINTSRALAWYQGTMKANCRGAFSTAALGTGKIGKFRYRRVVAACEEDKQAYLVTLIYLFDSTRMLCFAHFSKLADKKAANDVDDRIFVALKAVLSK